MDHDGGDRPTYCRQCFKQCATTCSLTFWILCVILYLMQFLFGIWSAVLRFLSEDYGIFSVTVVPLVVPTIFLSVVSIVWYWEQDRMASSQREAHPQDGDLQRYKRLMGPAVTMSHITGLGVLYRYSQLIVRIACSSRSCGLQQSLKRDSLLLQFLHCFLTSAPLLIIHLYQLLLSLVVDTLNITSSTSLISLGCVLATSLSLVLTLFSYIVYDRLHSEKRRVVFPGHVTALIWHLCMVTGRVLALTLFTVAHGPYIAAVIGVHWIITTIWTLFERTNFCGDTTTTPPKKRVYLEIPFALAISFVFIFLFFNVRDGPTMSRVIVYHVLTSVETLILAALFYIAYPNVYLSPWAFAFTIGFFIVGVAFMFLYYAAWHPSRTADCFLLGIPHSCDCCGLFYKRDNETGNVDLPMEEESGVQLGGVTYNVRRGTPGGIEDAGICQTDYEPLSNLSVLAERRSKFTVGQLSRSLQPSNTTSTPGQVQRSSSNLVRYSSEGTPSFTPTPKSSTSIMNHPTSSQEYNRAVASMRSGRVGISPRTSMISQRDDTRVRSGTRPMSMNMVTRSVSDNMGTRPAVAVAAGRTRKRPASENINTTPRHSRQSWFPRSGSDGYPYQPTALLGGGKSSATEPSNPLSAPLPRRLEGDKGGRPDLPYLLSGSRNSSHFSRLHGTMALPSPIGEEPPSLTTLKGETGLAGYRNQFPPPFVLKVNGTTPKSLEDVSRRHTVTEQPYATPYSYKRNGMMNPRWSDGTVAADFSPRLGRKRYISTPVQQTRQRSLSPVLPNAQQFSRRSSPNSYSASCTPKHSPYGGRRHCNPSNPLHTHDPMQEFTQLYTTSHSAHNSPKRNRRASSHSLQVNVSGEDGGPPRITSTSSSYLVSSDNLSETDTDERTTSIGGGAVPLPQTLRHPVLNGATIVNKRHDYVKITAYRQNSDEFLTTNLQNINGTLV